MEMLQLSSGYGSIDVPLSFSRTHCRVFLFQVVRLFLFGALDEDIKTAKMQPRHGRRRRPAEVVETIVSLLTLLDRAFYKTLRKCSTKGIALCSFHSQLK